MAEWEYRVIDQDGHVIADHMNLDNAAILLKALFLEYFNDPALVYSIERYDDAVKAENEG